MIMWYTILQTHKCGIPQFFKSRHDHVCMPQFFKSIHDQTHDHGCIPQFFALKADMIKHIKQLIHTHLTYANKKERKDREIL